jgi:hypothetical protein
MPDTLAGGACLFLMAKLGDSLMPGGSAWHGSVEAAKLDALETLKIRESDWIEHDGEPAWVVPFREAAADTIRRCVEAREANFDDRVPGESRPVLPATCLSGDAWSLC